MGDNWGILPEKASGCIIDDSWFNCNNPNEICQNAQKTMMKL